MATPANRRSRDEDLARIGAESQKHIIDARASCEDSRRHIAASKLAIARSLNLLKEPYSTGIAPDAAAD